MLQEDTARTVRLGTSMTTNHLPDGGKHPVHHHHLPPGRLAPLLFPKWSVAPGGGLPLAPPPPPSSSSSLSPSSPLSSASLTASPFEPQAYHHQTHHVHSASLPTQINQAPAWTNQLAQSNSAAVQPPGYPSTERLSNTFLTLPPADMEGFTAGLSISSAPPEHGYPPHHKSSHFRHGNESSVDSLATLAPSPSPSAIYHHPADTEMDSCFDFIDPEMMDQPLYSSLPISVPRPASLSESEPETPASFARDLNTPARISVDAGGAASISGLSMDMRGTSPFAFELNQLHDLSLNSPFGGTGDLAFSLPDHVTLGSSSFRLGMQHLGDGASIKSNSSSTFHGGQALTTASSVINMAYTDPTAVITTTTSSYVEPPSAIINFSRRGSRPRAASCSAAVTGVKSPEESSSTTADLSGPAGVDLSQAIRRMRNKEAARRCRDRKMQRLDMAIQSANEFRAVAESLHAKVIQLEQERQQWAEKEEMYRKEIQELRRIVYKE